MENKWTFIKGDIEAIQEISWLEHCKNEKDIVTSETLWRILSILWKQMNRWVTKAKQIDINHIKWLFHFVFVTKWVIALKEQEELISFFSSPDILERWNTLLQSLMILQSNENKAFIRSFLENENGIYDSVKLIHYILDSIRNYPLVVDINIVWKLYNIASIEWVGLLYSYVDSAQKYKVFLVKENNEIFHFSNDFEQEPVILENDLLFWVESKYNDENWEDKDAKNNKVWTLYYLNQVKNLLDPIYTRRGMVHVDLLDEDFDLYTTQNQNGKLWVVQMVEVTPPISWINQILAEEYDRITMWKDALIITENGEWENEHMSIWIHTSKYNEKKEVFRGVTIWKIIGLDHLHFMEKLPIFYVKGDSGMFYYQYDTEKSNITPISWLQWVNYIPHNFFTGTPTIVKENWKMYLKVFDTATTTVRNLLEIHSNTFPNIDTFHTPVISLWFYKVGNIETPTLYDYVYNNGKLYKLKNNIENIWWNLYKVPFIWRAKSLNISLYSSDFSLLALYIEEIPEGTIFEPRNLFPARYT